MNQLIQQIPLGIDRDDDTIDLSSYADAIAENRWLIVTIALIVTLLGAAFAFIAKPVYEASILIQVEDNSGLNKDSLAQITTPIDTKMMAASEMEILKSRMVVSRAVDNLRLYIDVEPKRFPLIGDWIARGSKTVSQPGLFGYGSYVWGAERADVAIFDVPEELEGEAFVMTVLDNGRFRLDLDERGIQVEGVTGSMVKANTTDGEIELLVNEVTAKPGAQFELTRMARIETIEKLQEALTVSEKGKQSGIIGVSLERTDRKLASAILDEIGREYIRQNVERKSEEAERSLAFLNKQLPDLKRDMERSESALNAIRNRLGTVDLAEETKNILQQSSLAQTRLAELKQRRDGLATRYQDEHPEVVAIDRQIRSLNQEISGLDTRIKKLPEVEQDVFSLTRDVKVNTELYTALLTQAQQLRVATASKVGNARLLDNAIAPVKPIKPKPLLIIPSAALLGLVLGIMAALTKRNLSTRIETPHQIHRLLELPISATIPHSERQEQLYAQVQSKAKKVSILSQEMPTDHAVESLRGFRASLQFSMRDARNNIIVITGPTPGVGKSFVSSNFAAVLAASGKRVLLIDGDLRTGHLHRYFGLDRRNGLADVVVGRVSFAQAIHKGVVENVDFLSTGALPPKPSELLAHENFGKLLQVLSARYDFVLVDTPPVLAVADALAVSAHAGAIFNIVRGGVTTKSEIEETVKRLNQAGHAVTGVVFNDSRARPIRYGYELTYGKYRYA